MYSSSKYVIKSVRRRILESFCHHSVHICDHYAVNETEERQSILVNERQEIFTGRLSDTGAMGKYLKCVMKLSAFIFRLTIALNVMNTSAGPNEEILFLRGQAMMLSNILMLKAKAAMCFQKTAFINAFL